MITITTRSSSSVKPLLFPARFLAMVPPLARLDVRAQIVGGVLRAGRVLHDDRRAHQHLAAAVEVRPVVVAELEVVDEPRSQVAERARVVHDLVAVLPALQEAARALAL